METENYVYKKEIDWSTLMEGFTLPLDNQVIFLHNMKNFLQRGESKIIHFFMNGKTYDAKIVSTNYICLFDYLFISSQMSAKPYFIGSTGILLLW